ncbi:dipeptide epimerase [Parvibaculaceae bacterium PLY_AMNH_Bact1]|nr:dipeptide epimerase [Parvibaculaceae bacterium PLY_AMNH_Bact1]
MTSLTCSIETWPLATAFNISRGAKTEAKVVVATIQDGEHAGRGECVPYARYGETLDGVVETINALSPVIENGLSRADLQLTLPPGAARNAVDCAFWDLEAKRSGKRVADLVGVTPAPLTTAFSLSLDSPDKMSTAAIAAASRPLLKIKLGGDGDEDRIAAVRAGAPDAKLIIDANEGWTPDNLIHNVETMAKYAVSLIEQPLPASDDEILRSYDSPVPICADESCHGIASLAPLIGLYDAVNIKLDKTGGLTEALATARAARDIGFDIMVGCMVGTSLGMAPAMLVAHPKDLVDLDGPLLLKEDKQPGIIFKGSEMLPFGADVWG